MALAAAPVHAQPSTDPNHPTPLTGPVASRLGGSANGAFHYFQFDYAGDGSAVVLMLSFNPSDPGVAPGISLAVYQDGQLMAQIMGGNYCVDTTSLVFTSRSSSPALVQLANYIPNVIVNYTLTPIGLPNGNAPIATGPPTRGNTSAQSSVPLGRSASGVLQGNPGGAFAYFTLLPPFPGANVALLLWFFPFDPVTANGVGFNVYQDGANLGGASGATAACTRNAVTSVVAPTTHPLLIQVYNYTPHAVVAYVLTQP